MLQDNREIVLLPQERSDEIDIAAALRALASEYKLFLTVLMGGVLLTALLLAYLPKKYLVESVLRVPTIEDLGELNRQTLIKVDVQNALVRVVEKLTSTTIQMKALEQSELLNHYQQKTDDLPEQILGSLKKDLVIKRIKYDYYELDKTEKTPLKTIRLSLHTKIPELSQGFLEKLISESSSSAMSNLVSEINRTKAIKLESLNKRLNALTNSEFQNRLSEISRLTEKNQESIQTLELKRELSLAKAKRDRENHIIVLEEALVTASDLGIEEPIAWEDLRPERSVQITNDLDGSDQKAPLYFRGTRMLKGELQRLKSRTDDRPFVNGITQIENEISNLENDPKLEALKNRSDDSLYIEGLAEIQNEIAMLTLQPDVFNNVKLAVIDQHPSTPSKSTRKTLLILIAGIFCSIIFALFVVLMKLVFKDRDEKDKQPQGLDLKINQQVG